MFSIDMSHLNDVAVQWNWLGALLRNTAIPEFNETVRRESAKFNSAVSMALEELTKLKSAVSMTVVNDAAAQWNLLGAWLRHTAIPEFNEVVLKELAKFNSAVSMVTYTIILFLIIFPFLVIPTAHRQVKAWKNQSYIRHHYGDDIDAMTQTCISLITFQCHRATKRFGPGTNARALLVAENEELECRIWEQGRKDDHLRALLFSGDRFVFKSVKMAMEAVGKCSSTTSRDEASFIPVFILISSQHPAVSGPHKHGGFELPKSMQEYVIIGTGFHGVAAHKLSRYTVGLNKEWTYGICME